MKNAKLWRDAAELPDREEDTVEEITDWSHCEKHGKYPTEETEQFGYDRRWTLRRECPGNRGLPHQPQQ